MPTKRTISAARQKFISDNKQWRVALGYEPTDLTVQAVKRGSNLIITASSYDLGALHEISIKAKGTHPNLIAAIAESFRESIGASKSTANFRRSA